MGARATRAAGRESGRTRSRQGRHHLRDDRGSDSQRTRQCSTASSAPPATTVVIEEFLEGEEASFIAIVVGEHILPLATSQDHKRRDDADRGPNTGGMGAYSPAPVVTDEIHARIMREVMEPTVRGLIARRHAVLGFLYAGHHDRAGRHAERARVQLPLRRSRNTADHDALAIGSHRAVRSGARRAVRSQSKREWDPRAALGVVLAAGGYPESVRKGDVISGLDAAARLPGKVFHAGHEARARSKSSRTAVACCAPSASAIPSAKRSAPRTRSADAIQWNGMHYRRDIGYRAIAREQG